LDADERSGGDRRDQGGVRRGRRAAPGELDQIDDRSHDLGRRRDRAGDDGAGGTRPDRAADHQLPRAPSRVRPLLRAEHRAGRADPGGRLELVRLRWSQRLPPGAGDRAVSDAARPELSVVIPVFNEARSLGVLHARLVRTLEKVDRPYAIIFVDDGSRDESADVLRALRARDPAVRMIRFTRNYGQHAALLAGMERARGEIVVTLDADLQNPPEEIPRLLAVLEDGADVAGGWRVSRRDPWARRGAAGAGHPAAAGAGGGGLRGCGGAGRGRSPAGVGPGVAVAGSAR